MNKSIAIKRIHSKISLMSTVMLLLTIVLVSACTNTHDYQEYLLSYNGVINPNFEVGYAFLENVFSSLGISFDVFKLLTMGLGILLIHQTVKKYVRRPWQYYLLYILVPLAFDAYNIRNFLAMATLIYAFPLLIENKPWNNVKYILALIVATSLHRLSILFLLCLFVKIYINKKAVRALLRFWIILGISLAVMAILYRPFLDRVLQFVTEILSTYGYITSDKIIYFEILGHYGFLMFFGLQLLFIVLLWKCNSLIKTRFRRTPILDNGTEFKEMNIFREENNRTQTIAYFILILNIVMLIMVPTYMVNSNYFRFYRDIIPLNYICILMVCDHLPVRSRERIFVYLATVFLVLLMFFMLIWGERDIILFTLFRDNWIFNSLF